MIVINAANHILGRLAAVVAKKLLSGEEIVIVNAEKIVIVGSRTDIFAKYTSRRNKGSARKGPFYPRTPHLLVKRAVRGMLPYRSPRGRAAYKKLRVYVSLPDAYKRGEHQVIENALLKKKGVKFVTINELSKFLGWNMG